MAFETEDIKSILIIIEDNGKFKLSGFVRQVEPSGDTRMRLTNQNLTSIVFDGVEFIDPPSSGNDGDVSQSHLSTDWAVDLT